jgi:hypothetical protein
LFISKVVVSLHQQKQTDMKTQLETLKLQTLSEVTVKAFMAGQIKSQDDLVTLARVWMTDLAIGFKEALEMVSGLIEKIINIQDGLLRS